MASVSVFAANPAKGTVPADDKISFSALPSHQGVDIKVQSASAAKAIVMISDQDGNVIFKDAMPAYKEMEKGYILNQLDNGDYKIEVIADHQTVTKDVHVYDEDGAKEFIISE